MKKKCLIICPNPSFDIVAKIDSIQRAQTNRISCEKRFPGGKGVHVAMALEELGVPTILMGVWGRQNGQAFKSLCKIYYPNLELIGPYVDGSNRSCYTFKSDSEWNETEILGTGPLINESVLNEFKDEILNRKSDLHSLAICGSWPPGAKEDYNYQLNELAKEINIPMYIDCTGPQLSNVLKGNPYAVHLNHDEITTYFDMNFEDAVHNITSYCEVAAITQGAEGLSYISKSGHIHANVRLDDVLTTVGSGDCLTAGLIAGHYLGCNHLETAALATSCGAANCIYPDLGMLRKSDVDKLTKRVVTQSLN